jgi:hypothetical protein
MREAIRFHVYWYCEQRTTSYCMECLALNLISFITARFRSGKKWETCMVSAFHIHNLKYWSKFGEEQFSFGFVT